MARTARGRKIRLESSDGSSSKFWEARLEGARVTTRGGRVGTDGREFEKTLPTADAARAHFDELVAKKQREGYSAAAEAARSTSRKGVQARNPALEDAIREAPDDVDGYLVYADWLQQQGDPRGELIVVQHELATTDAPMSITRREKELLKTFETELLGPLAGMRTLRNSKSVRWGLALRWGFIQAARLYGRWQGGPGLAEQLSTLLENPASVFLRKLILAAHSERGSSWGKTVGDVVPKAYARVFEILAQSSPRTLATLCFDEESDYLGDIKVPWRALTGLEHFALRGAEMRIADIDCPSLRTFELNCVDDPRESIEALARASLPRLDTLRIHLGAREAPPVLGAFLADLGRFPALRSLEVAFSWPAPHVLDTLRGALSSRRLSELTFVSGWSGEMEEALLRAAPALRAIEHLSLGIDPLGYSDAVPLREALSPIVSAIGPVAIDPPRRSLFD